MLQTTLVLPYKSAKVAASGGLDGDFGRFGDVYTFGGYQAQHVKKS